jgi:hypothetical protein
MVVTRSRGHRARVHVTSSRAPSSKPWRRPRKLENRAAPRHDVRSSGRVLMPLETTGINSRLCAPSSARKRISPYILVDIAVRHVFLHATVAWIAVQSAKRALSEKCRFVSPSIVAGAAPGSPEKSSEDLEVGRSAEAVSRFPAAPFGLSRCSAFAHVSRYCRRGRNTQQHRVVCDLVHFGCPRR